MNSWKHVIDCAVVLLVATACSTESSSGSGGTGAGGTTDYGPVDTTDFCEDWVAACPDDADEGEPGPADDVAECKQKCEVEQDMSSGVCWFKACSLEAGKCDNEEDGDGSIEACANDHGWNQP